MQITYLVGNGLDISYGLRTKYSDFYDYQKPIYEEKKRSSLNYTNIIYENIFRDSTENYENWSDLELSIGKLTFEILGIQDNDTRRKFLEDFLEIYEDLHKYLSYVEEEFKISNRIDNVSINFKATLQNLIPDLREQDQDNLNSYLSQFGSTSDSIQVITFNYTQIFDILYKNSITHFLPPYRETSTYNAHIEKPLHGHGTLSENMILGLNDTSQLSPHFSETETKDYLKTEIMLNTKENMLSKILNIIENTDLFVVFGMSIGDTDKYLWESIGKKALNDKIPIILHCFDKNFSPSIPHHKRRLVSKIEDTFIRRTNVSKENSELLREQLMIVVNKSIFEITTQ